MGIVFQRWKIVLEQMCSKLKDKDNIYMKNVYMIDKFLIILQEMILLGVKIHIDILKYTFVTNDVETYNQNKISFSDIYDNNDTYKRMFNEIEKSDILIEKINDPENINDYLIKIINLVTK